MSRRRRFSTEPVELEIVRLAADGRGIAGGEGRRQLVHGALAGERVRARIRGRRKGVDELATEVVLTPAGQRVTPFCPHFDRCGGCSLQHMDPAAQVRFKEERLRQLFREEGGVEPEAWLPPLTGPLQGYRHKARLGVRYVEGRGGALVGFRERGSSRVAELESCGVLDARVGERITDLRAVINALEAPARIPQIEVALGDDAGALVIRHLDPLSEADRECLTRFAMDSGLRVYLQPGGPDSVERLWPSEGPDELVYGLPEFDLEMAFLPMDFTQVNPALNRAMVRLAVDLLDPAPGDRVLDLFCGIGNFSLPLARRGAEVTGVEGDPGLVGRATANARRNGIANARFFAADLREDYTGSPWAGAFDRILLDPPRSGAAEIVAAIDRFDAPRILYIACGPAALARDARELEARGYRLRRAGVMDMFPHTAHVESIALFER